MILTGVLYFVSLFLFNYSLKFITAAISGTIIYLAIPMSHLLDYLFFDKRDSTFELIGVGIILVVNISMGVLKGKGII